MRRVATVLESVEEIRALARSRGTLKEAFAKSSSPAAPPPPAPAPGVPRPAPTSDAEAEPFLAPPGAPRWPCSCGDLTTVATTRARRSACVATPSRSAGSRGDLVIPHDGVHVGPTAAEISQRVEGGVARWYLPRPEQHERHRSVSAPRTSSARGPGDPPRAASASASRSPRASLSGTSPQSPGGVAATQKWQAIIRRPTSSRPPPRALERSRRPRARAAGSRSPPPRSPSAAIGIAARSCWTTRWSAPSTPGSPGTRSSDVDWIHNAASRNGSAGTRVEEVPLDRGGQFQCGEQRFLIKIL